MLMFSDNMFFYRKEILNKVKVLFSVRIIVIKLDSMSFREAAHAS